MKNKNVFLKEFYCSQGILFRDLTVDDVSFIFKGLGPSSIPYLF